MKNHSSQMRHENANVSHYILSLEIEQKASIMHYHEHKYPFFRITTALPKHVPIARGNTNTLPHHSHILFVLSQYISNFLVC
jgi:hypothetical protein